MIGMLFAAVPYYLGLYIWWTQDNWMAFLFLLLVSLLTEFGVRLAIRERTPRLSFFTATLAFLNFTLEIWGVWSRIPTLFVVGFIFWLLYIVTQFGPEIEVGR